MKLTEQDYKMLRLHGIPRKGSPLWNKIVLVGQGKVLAKIEHDRKTNPAYQGLPDSTTIIRELRDTHSEWVELQPVGCEVKVRGKRRCSYPEPEPMHPRNRFIALAGAAAVLVGLVVAAFWRL